MSLGSEETYKKFFVEGLKPDPVLTVSEWADEYRILSRVSSAEPGQWSTKRTPYLKDIMDDLSASSLIQEVIFMKGAQIGATEGGNNWLGYVIDHVPGPMLSVMPRGDDAKKNSKIRVTPMIEASERLKSKVKEARSRDSGNTILQKEFPGGVLVMTGANSAAALRSMPVRYLFLDEIDGYPGDVEGEGDPIDLATKRTDTFSGKKKIYKCSTPTIEGRSKIEAAYNQTDQRRFFVPCPSCGFMQWLKWAQLKWENDDSNTAHYECEECSYKIKNWQKTKMLEKGEWRATSESKNNTSRGYHLSGLYSPVGWLSWEQIVDKWLQANNPKNLEKLKTFMNTVLGESWKDKGEAPDWEKVYRRRESYETNTIPEGVCFLTAGVDVQEDRIECEIVGWGRNKRSWSIDYRVFYGDTSSTDKTPWLELQNTLAEVWVAPNEVDLEIKRTAIDTGYRTQIAYEFVRNFSLKKCIAIKGSDFQSVILNQGNLVDIKKKNRRIRKALRLFTVGVSVLKSELYGWLKQELSEEEDAREPYGFCHFPEYDQEHFKRLTSETLEVKWVKGRKKYEWVANGRNEQLDCRIYARAAASYYGMDRFKQHKWDSLEAEVGVTSNEQEVETAPGTKKKRKKVKIVRRKSNFT
jgi:phage terminase large subunit GpA-like protein